MNDQNDVAIKVEGLSKSFKLPHEKQNSIKGLFINVFNKKKSYESQNVLKNINFEIKKGEFFGIVGKNGSGKSTLLKLLAGVYTPGKGSILVNGKLTPFIELGVGFNPELTGRENVFLNGALLGLNRKEMDLLYDEIVDFAELERFMDQRLKNYSSGMQVRLAFSIAIRANTDILVLDEVLAVGDAAFQQKCIDYFYELKKKGTTVILVTHDMSNVDKFCTRALIIDGGRVKSIGQPKNIAKQYTLDNLNAEKQNDTNKKLGNQIKNLDVVLKSKPILASSDTLEFDVIYELKEYTEVDLGISIVYQNISIVEQNTKKITLDYTTNKKHKITYKFPLEQLNPGRYEVHVAIFKKKKFVLIGFNTDSCTFMIDNIRGVRGGVLAKRGEWIKQ